MAVIFEHASILKKHFESDRFILAGLFEEKLLKIMRAILKNDIKVTHEDRIKEQTTARDDNRGKNIKVILPSELTFWRALNTVLLQSAILPASVCNPVNLILKNSF